MINTNDILQTIQMIDHQHLDVRTITMGVNLLDCCDPDPAAACRKISSSSPLTAVLRLSPSALTPITLVDGSLMAAVSSSCVP